MRLLKILLLGSLFSTSAHATVLFENTWDTSVGQSSAWCSSCGTRWRAFDTFTLDQNSSISQIDAELYLSGVSQINYSIWDTGRNTQLFSQTVSVGDLLVNSGYGSSNRFVSAAISGLQLGAGSYALSIWNSAAGGTLGWHAIRGWNDGSNTQCYYATTNSTCYSRRGDQAFSLHGLQQVSVPEPTSIALFVMGIVALVLIRKKTYGQA